MARDRGAGTFTKLADGRWQYRISLGVEDGTRERHRFYGRTQQECRDQAEEYRHNLRLGMAPPDGELLREYLPRWLEARRHEMRPNTYTWYRMHINANILPAVGSVAVTDLTRQHVVSMMSKLVARPLSPRSVNAAKGALGTAMQDAMRDGTVTQNVVRLVKQLTQQRTEFEPLTASQIELFCDAVRGSRDEALYQVALAFGLRQGELLGLTWEDVDLDRGLLHVRRTLHHRGDTGGYHLEDVKTRQSQRVIRMPGFIADALRRQRDDQIADRVRMGEEWPDFWPELVFRTTHGMPMHAPLVTRRFQRQLKKLGISRRRFHDLRHTCATYLLMSGVDMKVIQTILGHSTMKTTSDVYAHVLPQMQEAALEHMTRMLSGQPSAQQPAESPVKESTTVKAGI